MGFLLVVPVLVLCKGCSSSDIDNAFAVGSGANSTPQYFDYNDWHVRTDGLQFLSLSEGGNVMMAKVRVGPFHGGAYPVSAMRSGNNGYTWVASETLDSNTMSVMRPDVFVNAALGFRIIHTGTGSILRRTHSGGFSWATVLETPHHLEFIAHAPGGKVFTFGSTTVLRSDDEGISWTDITSALPVGAVDMVFVDAMTGYACGQNGLWRTVDGGTTWVLLQEGDFIRIVHRDALHGAVVRRNTGSPQFELFHSSNGWATMTYLHSLSFWEHPDPVFIQERGHAIFYDADGSLYVGMAHYLKRFDEPAMVAHIELDMLVRISGMERAGDMLVVFGQSKGFARKPRPL